VRIPVACLTWNTVHNRIQKYENNQQNAFYYRIFSNPIRTQIQSSLVFADILNEKKTKLVRGSNPHLSFKRPLPTRQTDSVMSDDGESDE